MPIDCPDFPACRDRRTADAEHRGKVEAKLENIEKSVSSLCKNFESFKDKIEAKFESRDKDIRNLYIKIALLSGGISAFMAKVIGG